MSEKGFLVDSEKTWRTGEVGVWRSEAIYSKREREEGREGEWSDEKKNNLLNEKEFDKSVFSKTDKLNLSGKLKVATSGFAGISGAE